MTVSVIAFGADPTGRNDSAAAFDAAVSAAAAIASSNALPADVGSGRVTLDLGGGTYLISRPIKIQYHSGITVSGGTLVADARVFPADGFLLDVSSLTGFSFRELTLDNQHVGGGMRFDGIVQVDVSGVFFLHYKTDGIFGDDVSGASHELMVQDSFFAEFMWGEVGFDNIQLQSGTAIYLSSQFYDSNFYNSIIRCTRVGIVNEAGANAFFGFHVYATCNKNPDGLNVSVGLLQAAWGQTRVR